MDTHLAKVMPRGYVDVILGGRSHVKVSCKGKWHSDDKVVLHSGYHGENYGLVNVEVTSDGLAISTDGRYPASCERGIRSVVSTKV